MFLVEVKFMYPFRNPETSMSVPIDDNSREDIPKIVTRWVFRWKQRWLLITVSGDERERENKIDRSRPPKVIGVEKNTQMVSPFGWKLKKDIHLETIQMGYVLDNKWFSQTL